ncbi:MAG: outer membrane beta-barrel protein, partial [Sphingomonas oligoaromativorans]
SVGYQSNKFNNLDRVDGRLATSAGMTYRLNRFASLELNYDRLDQSSHGADRYRAYVDNRVLAGVTLRR